MRTKPPRRLTALVALLSAAPAFGQTTELRSELFTGMKWREIGPLRGGRSLGCAGSPGRVNEYYFGATGGGLWKTTDSGNTWFPVTDGKITSSSIGAVAVAETNPDVVYIGGGEVQLRGSITQGDGVYKSTDGGVKFDTVIRPPHGDNHDLWITPTIRCACATRTTAEETSRSTGARPGPSRTTAPRSSIT